MNSVAIAPAYIHSSVKRRKNTWYSIANGNWTDPNIWMSNAQKRWNYPGQNITAPLFPQIGDDVYINHAVACNTTAVVNNLYISGSLTSATNSIFLSVNGDIQCTGSVSFTSSINLILYGVNNYIISFTGGTLSTVTYTRAGDQYIMPLTYRNLTAQGAGTKYVQSGTDAVGTFLNNRSIVVLQSNTTISGALTNSFGTLTASTYDLTVTGIFANQGGIFSKTGSGSLLFIGAITDLNAGGTWNLSGNPTVECRGGIASWNTVNFTSGTGTWSFTTNNQSLSFYNRLYQFNGNVVVTAINATLNFRSSISIPSTIIEGMQINSSLDGTGTFTNNGNLIFNTTSVTAMSAGTFVKSAAGNFIGYVYPGAITLPYTTYQGLFIGNAGNKTLSGNSVISGNLQMGLNGTYSTAFLELSTYNFTVTGQTNYPTNQLYDLRIIKSGSGNILFTGLVSLGNINPLAFDFSGNPTVEFRGGIILINNNAINSGTGVWTFSTNNQSISINVVSPVNLTIDAPILISGAITLSTGHTGPAGVSNFTFTNTINGNNAASTFDNRETVNYQNTTRPMVTGVLQTNAAENTWIYNKAGAQDITGGTYRTLTLAGSGVKTLQGNVVVATLYTLTAPATLVLNGFTRT